jgi:hypothetical protein
MKPTTTKYILLYYLYKIIDDKFIFEYNWTDDTWEFCTLDTTLPLRSGEEISEEHAIAWTEEIRKQLDTEPYTRIHAMKPTRLLDLRHKKV